MLVFYCTAKENETHSKAHEGRRGEHIFRRFKTNGKSCVLPSVYFFSLFQAVIKFLNKARYLCTRK
jgi:hypothetical protein